MEPDDYDGAKIQPTAPHEARPRINYSPSSSPPHSRPRLGSAPTSRRGSLTPQVRSTWPEVLLQRPAGKLVPLDVPQGKDSTINPPDGLFMVWPTSETLGWKNPPRPTRFEYAAQAQPEDRHEIFRPHRERSSTAVRKPLMDVDLTHYADLYRTGRITSENEEILSEEKLPERTPIESLTSSDGRDAASPGPQNAWQGVSRSFKYTYRVAKKSDDASGSARASYILQDTCSGTFLTTPADLSDIATSAQRRTFPAGHCLLAKKNFHDELRYMFSFRDGGELLTLVVTAWHAILLRPAADGRRGVQLEDLGWLGPEKDEGWSSDETPYEPGSFDPSDSKYWLTHDQHRLWAYKTHDDERIHFLVLSRGFKSAPEGIRVYLPVYDSAV